MVGSPARAARVEADAGGADVVREDCAELVVRDLADEAARAAQRRDPRDGVRRRSARHLCARPHLGVQRVGLLGREDQLHRALGHAVLGDEGVVGLREDVDDGVADRDDVVGGLVKHLHGTVVLTEACAISASAVTGCASRRLRNRAARRIRSG